MNQRISFYRLLFDPMDMCPLSTREATLEKTAALHALLVHRWGEGGGDGGGGRNRMK